MASSAFGQQESQYLLVPPTFAGKAVRPDSLYAKTWPGRPGLYKLNERVILQIPPQFHKFWLQRDATGKDLVMRPPTDLATLPTLPLAGFVMHLPDFGGYTPDNYQRDFDENRVEVVEIAPASPEQMAPGAPGSYPPNMFARFMRYRPSDAGEYTDRYGLRCYAEGAGDRRQTCVGKRNASEDILLEVLLPPYGTGELYPQMRTVYFSPRYGGLEVAWRSNMKNFERWRDIDTQVWKYIDTWNVAPASANQLSPKKAAAQDLHATGEPSLSQQGAEFRRAILEAAKQSERLPRPKAEEQITNVVKRWIPVGTSFEEARAILTAAGFSVSPVPPPDFDIRKAWPYTLDVVAMLDEPLATEFVSASKLMVNLTPLRPKEYQVVGQIRALIHIAMP